MSMGRKKVLVCGASGFLGFNIFQALSQRLDLEVYGTYLSNRYNRISHNHPNLIEVDLTKKEDVNSVLSAGKYDVVIQMAANSSGAKDVKERPQLHVTPNVAMNNWLIAGAHEHSVGQFIFPSCTVMYPSSTRPSSELDFDHNNISPVYFGGAKMKLYAEDLCKFYSSLNRTRYTAIRHSNIYGPNDRFDPNRSHVFGATIRKVMESKDKVIVWGQGMEVRDFLYVSDFIDFITLILDHQDWKFDIFNLGSSEPVTISSLVDRIIRISGKNLSVEYDPDGPTIGTKISIKSSKASEKFLWHPQTCLDEGIRKTLDWYKNNYNRP